MSVQSHLPIKIGVEYEMGFDRYNNSLATTLTVGMKDSNSTQQGANLPHTINIKKRYKQIKLYYYFFKTKTSLEM